MKKSMYTTTAWATLAMCAVMGGCSSADESIPGAPREGETAATTEKLGATVGQALGPVMAVNAGNSPAQGWFTDEATLSFFGLLTVTGGVTPSASTAAVDTSRVFYPGAAAMYQSRRETNGAPFTYTFKGLTSNASYIVRLHFVDPTSTAANARKFSVSINGTQVLGEYDVFADAKNLTASSVGQNVAVIKPFNANASGTQLTVTVSPGSAGAGMLSGVDLIPGKGYLINPGRVGAMVGAYQGDSLFDAGAGNIFFTGSPIDTTLVPSPPPQDILKTQRMFNTTGSQYTYTLPGLVVGQKYNVRLYFAELDTAKQVIGARKFDVLLNGKQVLSNFDAFEAGGKPFWASERSFEVPAESDGAGGGRVRVTFQRVTSDPIINGIEVTPQIAYKFNVGGFATGPYQGDQVAYLSSSPGAVTGLATAQTITDSVTNTALTAPLAGVYAFANTAPAGPLGNMVYTLPGLVPGKLYRIRLHFADINPPSTGNCAGSRVFNVYVNGLQMIGNLDVCQFAGGPFRAYQHDLTAAADASGNLAIQFVNVTGQAIINGIEAEAQPPVQSLTAGYNYHVTAIGSLGRPAGVHLRDGGVSTRLANGKVLWTFADTVIRASDPAFNIFFRTGPTGTSDPPDVTWWTNTGGTADLRTPWILNEKAYCATGQTTGALCTSPTQPAATPTGQFVPFTQAQYDYNRANLGGWPCPTSNPGCVKNGTYYQNWPAAILPRSDGGATVFLAPSLVNNYGLPLPPGHGATGAVLYDSPPITTTATNPTVGTHTQLFAPNERLFVGAYIGKTDDGAAGQKFVYATTGMGQFGDLSETIAAGSTVTQLKLLASTHQALVQNETIELFDGVHRQIATVASSVGPEALTVPVTSFKANFDYAAYPAAGALVRRVGGTGLTQGSATTQIPVEAGLNAALPTGYRLQLSYRNNPPQDVTVAAPTATCTNAVGATCVAVASFVPNVNYPAVASFEPGGSLSYGPLARLGTALTQSVTLPTCGSTSPASVCLSLNSALAAPVKAGQTIEIGTTFGLRQEVTLSANAAAGATSMQVFGFTPNFSYAAGTNLNVVSTVLRSTFTPLGTLSAQRSSSTTYTAITFTNALPVTLLPGQQLQFWANDASGVQRVQAVTIASVSGQTVTTSAFTTPANTTFPVGTTIYQTIPMAAITAVRKTANFFGGNYIARAPYNETSTGYRNKANWRFWDQRQNSFAGGWVTTMSQGTAMLFSNGIISWNVAMAGAYNPYLGRYLALGSLGLGDDIYLSTAFNPQGPWSAPVLISGGNAPSDPAQRDQFPNVAGGDTPPLGAYYYAVMEHPEMRLDNGQTVYVSYVHGSEGGTIRLLQIQLPRPSDVPSP